MVMRRHAALDRLFADHRYTDFKSMDPKDIVVSHWVRMKCMYGCKSYGRNASCPPNVPSVAECQQFFAAYHRAALFHFTKKVDKPEDRHAWTRKVNQGLLQLERAVFLAGYYKAFLLATDSCAICATCPGTRDACKHPMAARPSPESMAVDIFATARRQHYQIQVLADYDQEMNRYAILLIE